jgi:hypothetical protein
MPSRRITSYPSIAFYLPLNVALPKETAPQKMCRGYHSLSYHAPAGQEEPDNRIIKNSNIEEMP